MKYQRPKFRATLLSASIAALMGASSVALSAPQTHIATHVFSIADVIGDYSGATVGTSGNGSDPNILCGNPYIGSNPCPADGPQPIPGDASWQLYPIDSAFGFEVVPFAFAVDKVRDGVYTEGWVGNIRVAGQQLGLEFSDAETDTFVVPAGLGTWCAGIGGTSVKCSTEHFVVMEHVLTCHETIPYYYADPDTGEQLQIEDPANPGTVVVDCADKQLDNNLRILNSSLDNPLGDAAAIDGKLVGTTAYEPTTGDPILAVDWAAIQSWADPDEVLTFLEPNESTVLDDIAYGASYSITAKDDGKALYRWGNLIKRPNDIRAYARFSTPAPWHTGWNQNGGLGYKVTKARLIINQKITNNPNDQVRPEDMENEGAIGRLPGYDVVGTYGPESRISDTSCYQGNGIEIPQGTVLRNTNFAIPDTTVPVTWENDPYGWSEDLTEGFTNAWFTTVDREPFEWAYDTDGDGAADESYRDPLAEPLPAGTTLLSGPRWRLLPGKFGQDLPALDIPNVNCAPPPYQRDLIKYPVGDYAVETLPAGVDGSKVVNVGPTVLNLLDWSPDDDRGIPDPANPGEYLSPLSYSNGWISGWFNDGTEVNWSIPVVNPSLEGVSINGSPVSKGFDLTVYVKGDRKPTALYNARLEVEWDNGL